MPATWSSSRPWCRRRSKPSPPSRPWSPRTPTGNIDQGDKAADGENFQAALAFYQKALKMEPANLVVQEKISEMKKLIAAAERGAKFKDLIKKADANYEKNKVKIAFLYLVEALRVFPEGKPEVQSRLNVISSEYPQELAAALSEKSAQLKDIRPQLDELLASRSLNPSRPRALKKPNTMSRS